MRLRPWLWDSVGVVAGRVCGTGVAGAALCGLAALAGPGEVAGQSLRGGLRPMQAQNHQAHLHDYTQLRDASHVQRFIELKLLVPLKGNRDYRLHQVSFPVARPEVRMFVQRLASQYRNSCGEQLVVTSLTRPLSHQPSNSSELSVHPMGMAVDLRRSNNRACRQWLERVLLDLEGQGSIEATRERYPPHYHIAVYPRQYASYVASLEARRAREAEEAVAEEPRVAAAGDAQGPGSYRVRSGDSLWRIARIHGTTVDELKSANNLRGSVIYAGQLLHLPSGS